MIWKLADAKNQFSKVVDKALEEGPQKITRRDKAVMVVALKDFQRMSGRKSGFKNYLIKAPSFKDLKIERDRSISRETSL